MKLTTLLILIGCLQISANGLSQTVTLNLNKAPLEKVFTDVSRQSGVSFLYSRSMFKNIPPISINVKDAKVEEVLKLSLQGLPFTYILDGNAIIIKKKPAETETISIQRPIDVRGRVVNEKGEPLVAATVEVKGTSQITTTNEDGWFEIRSVDENAILMVSSVGYKKVEQAIGGRTALQIILKTKLDELSQIQIVSTGFQEIAKERVTGSFVRIDNELVNRSVTTDILSRINGISNGLIFNTNRRKQNDISIRGRSTIFANDQPLIVLDNFPYEGDIDNINPNDIESISILKDAAAASIWGARSGNGVIVLVSKKAKFGKPLKIQVNNNITITNKPDLYYNPNFSPSAEFIDFEKYLFQKGYYSTDENSPDKIPLTPVVELLIKQRDGLMTEAEINKQIDIIRKNDIREDFEKYFYRKGIQQQYSINLSGGTDNINNYLSAGLDINSPFEVANKFKRITLNSINKIEIADKLQFDAGVNFVRSVSVRNNPGAENIKYDNVKMYPYARLADDQGNGLPMVKDYRFDFASNPGNDQLLDWLYRPVEELHLADDQIRLSYLRINAGFKYGLVNNTDIEIRYQYEDQNSQRNNHRSVKTYYVRDLINSFTQANGGSVSRPIPLGGIMDLSNIGFESHSVRAQGNYAKKWQVGELNALAGMELKEGTVNAYHHRYYGYDDEYGYTSRVDYINYFTQYVNNSKVRSIPNLETVSGKVDRFISFFGNAAYSYKNRYTLSASARKDASNLFGVKTNQRAVPLWSVGGLWDVGKENFYKSAWLPSLKIRATYGYNGNIDKSVTALLTARAATRASITNLPYSVIMNPPNDALRWEKVKTINLGAEFRGRNDIFSGSFELYHKTGLDLFGDAFIAPSIGFVSPSTGGSSVRGNFSSTVAKGLDIALKGKLIDSKLRWDIDFLFSYVNEKIKDYDILAVSNSYLISYQAYEGFIYPYVGKPLYSIYSYKWAGLDPLNGDPQGYLNNEVSKDYLAIINTTKPDQLIYNGPATPTKFGSLRNTFSIGQFSASCNLLYKFGYFFRRQSSGGWIGHRDFAERWQKPGDEERTNVPSLFGPPINSNRQIFYGYSETLVEKGDHIRLQDIRIDYLVNDKVLRSTPFKKVRFYLYLSNLGIVWRANNLGLDPDVAFYPVPKSYAAGLQIEL